MEKEKDYKKLISAIIFNIAETVLIFLVGKLLLKLPLALVITIMATFLLTRAIITIYMKSKNINTKATLHFKSWYRCLIWSLLIQLTLFLIVKVELWQSIILAVYAGFLLTGKANIEDMYLWGGNDLNQRVYEWVIFNLDSNKELMNYEKQLKENDARKYYIYVYRFRERKTYKQIAEIMDIAERRVTEELGIISHYIEYRYKIKIEYLI